jgi:hypothetical protein
MAQERDNQWAMGVKYRFFRRLKMGYEVCGMRYAVRAVWGMRFEVSPQLSALTLRPFCLLTFTFCLSFFPRPVVVKQN